MAVVGVFSGEAFTSLNAATATGAGDVAAVAGSAALGGVPKKIAWEVRVTGSPSAMQVDLEGSLDNSNWYQIDTYNTVANTLRQVVDKAAKFVRARLVTLTGGSSPTVTARILP
jgi:hypothetical protein